MVENLIKLNKLKPERINKLCTEDLNSMDTRNAIAIARGLKRRNLFHCACSYNKTTNVNKEKNCQFIKLLLDNGADLFIVDSNGLSPLARACKYNIYSVIRLLLERAKSQKKVGFKILSNATKENYDWCSIIFWLVKHDYDAQMIEYILRVAIETQLIDVTRNQHTLLAEKGDLSSGISKEVSPLTMAIHNNSHDIARCLISKFNVDVNRIDNNKVCVL